MIICPGCGADMQYDPERGMLYCSYCRTSISAQEYSKKNAGYFEARQYTCPQCGAHILSTDETVVTFCTYCGSSVLIEGSITQEKSPAKIIPFSVTKEQCLKAYRKYLSFSPLLPKEMRQPELFTKFCGVYMPYWIYNFRQNCSLDVNAGRLDNSGKVSSNEHCCLTVPEGSLTFKTAFDASSLFFDRLSKDIAPFESSGCVDFDVSYLSGFYADNGDVDAALYQGRANALAEEYATAKIGEYCKTRGYAADKGQQFYIGDFTCVPEKAMFPVWFLTGKITHKSGQDQVFHVVVNGQTGRITSDFPIDLRNFVIVSLVIAVPVLLFLKNLPEFSTLNVRIFAAFTAACSILISIRQFKESGEYEAGADSIKDSQIKRIMDENRYRRTFRNIKTMYKRITISEKWRGIIKWRAILSLAMFILMSRGIASAYFLTLLMNMASMGILIYSIIFLIFGKTYRPAEHDEDAESPLKQKLRFCWKPLAGLGAVLLVTNEYYEYSALFILSVIISSIMTIWSFIDIIRRHNATTTQKMPNVEEKGGMR